jgi:hypothetical protein
LQLPPKSEYRFGEKTPLAKKIIHYSESSGTRRASRCWRSAARVFSELALKRAPMQLANAAGIDLGPAPERGPLRGTANRPARVQIWARPL